MLSSFILCNGNPPRPILWRPDAAEVSQLTPAARAEMAATLGTQGIQDGIGAALVALRAKHAGLDVNERSYVIVPAFCAEDLRNELQTRGLTTLGLHLVREQMLMYHHRSLEFKFLQFGELQGYNTFFSEHIPRDLFAVRDLSADKWCLCVGTMLTQGEPMAVRVMLTSPTRQMGRLPWSELSAKLDQIFWMNGASIPGTTRLNSKLEPIQTP